MNHLLMKSLSLAIHLEGTDWLIDGNFMEVRSSQACQLCVLIREDAPLQQGIVTEIQAGDQMSRAESHLLRLAKKVVRITI